MSDPDEARLAYSFEDDLRKWRARTEEQQLAVAMRCADREAAALLGWLATAPPPAILLAYDSQDVERLRECQQGCKGYPYKELGPGETGCDLELVGQDANAFARARILDASTHVCLPRAEAEALLSASDEAVRHLDQWPGKMWLANELCTVANKLRALLAAETGKGEG